MKRIFSNVFVFVFVCFSLSLCRFFYIISFFIDILILSHFFPFFVCGENFSGIFFLFMACYVSVAVTIVGQAREKEWKDRRREKKCKQQYYEMLIYQNNKVNIFVLTLNLLFNEQKKRCEKIWCKRKPSYIRIWNSNGVIRAQRRTKINFRKNVFSIASVSDINVYVSVCVRFYSLFLQVLLLTRRFFLFHCVYFVHISPVIFLFGLYSIVYYNILRIQHEDIIMVRIPWSPYPAK